MFDKTFKKLSRVRGEAIYFSFQPLSLTKVPEVLTGRKFVLSFWFLNGKKSEEIKQYPADIVTDGGLPFALWTLPGAVSVMLYDQDASVFWSVSERINDSFVHLRTGTVTIEAGPPNILDYDDAPYSRYIDRVTMVNDPSNKDADSNFDVKTFLYDAISTVPVDFVPTNSVAPAILGTAQVGQVLTGSNGTWTNSPTAYSYRWSSGGVTISGATSSTYTIQSSDAGKTISVTVTASNSFGSSGASSAPTAAVTNIPVSAPANTALPTVSGTAQSGQVLTATTGTWSNSPTGYAYQWQRGTTNISGATSSTYTLVSGDVGSTVRVIVTATNAGGSTAANSASTGTIAAAPVSAPANTTAPAISGTAQVGQTLTVSNGTWTNSPTGYAYAWSAGGTVISGATASTYSPVSADVGKTITATVSATNAGGSVSASSAATSSVTAAAVAAPVNSAVPTVSGPAQVGQALTATSGTWGGSPTYAYQWQRGSTNITGATASTYTVVSGDVGSTLKVIVTATNAGGSVSAGSANTATVIAAPTTSTERSFSYNEYQQGWTLVREETNNPTRLRLNNSRDFQGCSHYMSIMTGTDARATFNSLFKTSVADRKAGLYFEVSVDGSAYAPTPYNDATDDFQLFSGLADGPHLVAIRTPASLYETVYIDKAASPLKVKGSAPAIKLVDQWLQPGQPNSNVHVGNGLDGFSAGPNSEMLVGGSLVNLTNAVVTPRKITDYRSGGTPSISFKANVSELWFVTGQRMIHVYDGTQTRVIDTGFDTLGGDYRGGDSIRVGKLTGLSGLKTYYVWTSSNGQPVYLSVGLVGGTAQPLTEGNRTLDQYGDSITQGVTATAPNTKPENDRGYVDTYRVAAKLGYTGCAIGVGGYTDANLNDNLAGWLERKTVTSADVAMIAIGQNNGISDTSIYNAIIDKLLSKGYGKVICRGVIPVQSGGWAAINTTIEGIVNGRADPRVKYMNVNSWTNIIKPDGIHPNVPGYDQIVDLSVAALPSLLA